ncbi:hypothetical protein CEP51_008369 [Fusarium floridanum]|uniref:2EXR domain-containing protein n=1 Tax=Fusarium floridanum TaxID=1325733 RepID=A0A428RL53_9HYPO|nr:hypothetical protein CEP51_008369 [Fusarium floridanum]
MYSNAPIPALLHTCTESRLALVNMGYQLAFQTRSSGPRTWFNFNRDILLIGPEPQEDDSSYDESTIDGSPPAELFWILSGDSLWDLGQFDPSDMRQVRKLAIRYGAEQIREFNHSPNPVGDSLRELSSTLQLFTRVEQLLLVEWCAGDLTTAAAKDELGVEHRRRHAYDTNGLWSCTDVAEVDGLLRIFSPEPSCTRYSVAGGSNNCLLSDHKIAHGNEASYFEDTHDAIRGSLAKEMARFISTEMTDIVIPWKIPQLRTIHILSPLEYRALSQERLKVAQHICDLQEEWGSIVRLRTEKSLSSWEWNLVKRDFEETNWPEDNHRLNADGGRCSWSDVMQKMWWVQEGPAPGVGDLLL